MSEFILPNLGDGVAQGDVGALARGEERRDLLPPMLHDELHAFAEVAHEGHAGREAA